MNKLLALFAAVCLSVPATVEAGGCFQQAVVRQRVQRVVHQQAVVNYGLNNQAYNNAYQATFVAVEQPYYLDLVAADKRQQIQAEKFENAVEASVASVLDTRLAQLIQTLRGDTGGPALPPVAGTPPANPVPGAPPANPTPDDVTKQLVAFLHTKCAECHTGANSKGTGEPFVMFADDGSPQLTPGKLIRSDLMLYSNRMPPTQKLTDDEYQSFRGAYQTWEREIREAAIKADK